MEIVTDIIIEDLFLYLKKHKTFILSDLHIGYGDELKKRGVILPMDANQELIVRAERAIYKLVSTNYPIERIVINGDLLHNFSKISGDERYSLEKFMKMLTGYAPILVIRGNHDKTLSFILAKIAPNIIISEEVILGDILITHGDIINDHSSDERINIIIIGHEHPAVSLGNGIRKEKFKCFLKGRYNTKMLIVMPSSNVFVDGSDILGDALLSPYLDSANVNLFAFEVFVVADKVYDFGYVKNLF